MAFNIHLIAFAITWDWKGIWEISGKVDSVKAYTEYDETSS
jgi:hypothetical protein